MTQATAPTEEERPPLPHRGELCFRFELNDFPDMEFRHYVSGAAVSPDGCCIALADHGGDVYIVHRHTPETRECSWLYKLPTHISYPSALALSDGASRLMVLDNEDNIRIFSRHDEVWREEGVRGGRMAEVRLHYKLHEFVLTESELLIKRRRGGEIVCRHIRWMRWWTGYFWKPIPVSAPPAQA